MSGKVQPIDWQESAEELQTRQRAATEVGERVRLQALWLVRSGQPEQGAAQLAGVGRRTLTRWRGWQRQGGLEEVLRRVPGQGAPGAARRRPPEQREALLARCAPGSVRTQGAAQHGVAQECGVRQRYAGLYDLLRRRTGHPKVPRPTAANAAPAAQAAWKKGACGKQPRRRRSAAARTASSVRSCAWDGLDGRGGSWPRAGSRACSRCKWSPVGAICCWPQLP